MQYIRLGNSGLKVSRFSLGAMSFGDPKLQSYGGSWVVGKEEAFKVLKRAWDLGINFFDTANVYSKGKSEEIIGEFANEIGREEVVIATKVYFPIGSGINDYGLSRKHIMRSVKESLKRLKTDYIDLYQTHRWDDTTPIEETLFTLTELVRQGIVRYIGTSSMWGWQLAKIYFTAEYKGYEKPISIQTPYNLLYREEEREIIPFCKAHNIAYLAYSPTAIGLLSGKYFKDGKIVIPPDATERLRPGSSYYGYKIYVEPMEVNSEIIKRVIEVAKNKGVTPTQIAIAWLLHKDVIPIIATSKVEHLEEDVEALNIKLSSDEIKYIEEPYKPKPVAHITKAQIPSELL